MNVGDQVYVDGYTSMAQQNADWETIEKIKTKYNDTGVEFQIYKVGDEWYDSRDGSCFSNPKSMYYLDLNQ